MDIEFANAELNIEINPPRSDGEPEGLTSITVVPATGLIRTQDRFTEPDCSDLPNDDDVDDNRQLDKREH